MNRRAATVSPVTRDGHLTATVMFTDLVGSTALREQLGEDAADALRRHHDALLNEALAAHGGTVIKGGGDGLMALFTSATDALSAAEACQQAVWGHNVHPDAAAELQLRVGLSIGDVQVEHGDCFGTPVIEAARLEAAAEGGQVLCSDLVRLMARGRGGHELRHVGELELKGLTESVETYELVWRPRPPTHQDQGLRVPFPRQLQFSPDLPFVERPDVWDILLRAWHDASSGRSRTVLVGGESGVGKTRLVGEFARDVHQTGATVLFGSSTEDVEMPFQPFVEAIRQLLDTLPGDQLDSLLGPSAQEDLKHLLRSGRTPDPSERADPSVPAAPATDRSAATGAMPRDRYWAFEAFVELLAAAADRVPLLLVLDDLQWAERPTVRLAEHLLRSGRLGRVLVLITHRDAVADQTAAFAESIGELSRRPGVTRLSLPSFDVQAVGRFVKGAIGSADIPDDLEPVIAHLAERTEGNAFLLVESWRHLLDSGRLRRDGGRWSVANLEQLDSPRSVGDANSHRLARLPAACRLVLELGACAGQNFEPAIVALAAEQSIAVTLELLAQANEAGILTEESNGRFAFVHALVRQAMEERLTSSERRQRHLAIGRSLAARYGHDHARLARHFAAAVPLEPSATAVTHARAAARQSLQSVSFDDATAVLRHVLGVTNDDLERSDLLADLASACAVSGASGDAIDACIQAADLARRHGDRARLVQAARAMAEATWRGARYGAPAVELLREALDLETDPAARCGILGGLSAALAFAGNDASSAVVADEAIELARQLDDPQLILSAIHNGLYTALTPDTVEAQLELARHGVELACRHRDELFELKLLCKAILRLFVVCDPADLAAQIRKQKVLAQRLRQPYYLLVEAGNAVTLALAEGRFDDAELAIGQYQTWAEVNGQPESGYGIQMFSLRREQGRLAELRPMLEVGARIQPDAAWRPGLVAVYAEVGMTDQAAALLDDLAADGLASLPRDTLLPGVLTLLADAAHATSHRATAAAVLKLLQPYSGLLVYLPGLVCYGSADRYLGKVHEVLDRRHFARTHFERAVVVDERTGWSCWIAHSRYELGRHLCAGNSTVERNRGRQLVESAHQLATEMAMASLIERCDRALATDTRIATVQRRADSGLTGREWEVLELLAEGRTNREIGELLHTSRHTVANHVRAVLAKTGSTNRTEAAAWAHRH